MQQPRTCVASCALARGSINQYLRAIGTHPHMHARPSVGNSLTAFAASPPHAPLWLYPREAGIAAKLVSARAPNRTRTLHAPFLTSTLTWRSHTYAASTHHPKLFHWACNPPALSGCAHPILPQFIESWRHSAEVQTKALPFKGPMHKPSQSANERASTAVSSRPAASPPISPSLHEKQSWPLYLGR